MPQSTMTICRAGSRFSKAERGKMASVQERAAPFRMNWARY